MRTDTDRLRRESEDVLLLVHISNIKQASGHPWASSGKLEHQGCPSSWPTLKAACFFCGPERGLPKFTKGFWSEGPLQLASPDAQKSPSQGQTRPCLFTFSHPRTFTTVTLWNLVVAVKESEECTVWGSRGIGGWRSPVVNWELCRNLPIGRNPWSG